MAAGVAGLSRGFMPESAEALSREGRAVQGAAERIGQRRGVPHRVTGVGSILCMHFQSEPIRRPDEPEHTPAAARALFHLEMLARGFYVARRGFIALSLPLAASDYDAFADAFEDFLGACGPVLRG